MGTSELNKDGQGNGQRGTRIVSGLLITVVIVLSSIIWSLKANQIDPAADPNWVPLSQFQETQDALTQQKKLTQEQQAKANQLGQKVSSLQRQLARQSTQADRMIPMDQLPRDLQGDSVQTSLEKILTLQKLAEVPKSHQSPIKSYFAILDHLQTHGVINTSEPAGDETRQGLYVHIQIALQSLSIEIQANDDLQKQTYDSVTRFQTAQKVKVDGKIGMQTFMAMVRQYQTLAESALQAQAETR